VIGGPLAGIGLLEIGFALGGILVALLVGYLVGRAKVRVVEEEHQSSRVKLGRAEKQIGELGRRIAKMRGERDTVANLALSLPEVFRKLNRPDLDDREVRRLIYMLANSLFQPEQFLLYWLDKDQKRLKLVVAHGLDYIPPELEIVQVGKGKIGWVARHELEMLPEDWKKLSQAERVQVPDNHPLLRSDLIGPLVHPGTAGAQVLGVLCLGAPAIRPRDEKLMFQMVTNFGSMATVVARQRSVLRKQADHDGLTGLFNKRHFLSKLAPEMLVACDKKARPFSIFIFDIDNFKNYNDTNGHPAGDKLLRRMGKIITEHLRPQDVACRYGGEEFVIAMADTTKELALERAEKLRSLITQEPFDHREKQPLGMVSISGGIASSPRDARDVDTLIKISDEALYIGKKGGRNKITAHQGVQIGEAIDEDVLIAGGAGAPSDHWSGITGQ
jgi:diguanylate cyclase (GGDEF)-like protein